MWYEVTAWCPEGPFKLLTDDYQEAQDWAAEQEKLYGCAPSNIEVHDNDA